MSSYSVAEFTGLLSSKLRWRSLGAQSHHWTSVRGETLFQGLHAKARDDSTTQSYCGQRPRSKALNEIRSQEPVLRVAKCDPPHCEVQEPLRRSVDVTTPDN